MPKPVQTRRSNRFLNSSNSGMTGAITTPRKGLSASVGLGGCPRIMAAIGPTRPPNTQLYVRMSSQ